MIKDLGKNVAYLKDSGKMALGLHNCNWSMRKTKLFKEMLQLFTELFDQFKFYMGMNNLEEGHKTENTHKSLALTSELFEKMNTQNDPRHAGWSSQTEKKTRLLNPFSAKCLTRKRGMCLMLRGKNLRTSDIWEDANQ